MHSSISFLFLCLSHFHIALFVIFLKVKRIIWTDAKGERLKKIASYILLNINNFLTKTVDPLFL